MVNNLKRAVLLAVSVPFILLYPCSVNGKDSELFGNFVHSEEVDEGVHLHDGLCTHDEVLETNEKILEAFNKYYIDETVSVDYSYEKMLRLADDFFREMKNENFVFHGTIDDLKRLVNKDFILETEKNEIFSYDSANLLNEGLQQASYCSHYNTYLDEEPLQISEPTIDYCFRTVQIVNRYCIDCGYKIFTQEIINTLYHMYDFVYSYRDVNPYDPAYDIFFYVYRCRNCGCHMEIMEDW